jgi:PmbA protein
LTDPVRATLDAVARTGDSHGDVCLVDQERLEVEVRAGEVDRLSRAHDRVLSLRLFRGTRVATLSSSDLTKEGVRSLVERARDLADAAEPDPCAGLPESVVEDDPDLELSCPRTAAFTAEEAVERAREADRAACAHDPQIRPIGSAGARIRAREVRIARSDGFDRSYRSTSASIHCIAIAVRKDEKQRDMVMRAGRSVDALPAAAEIGRECGARSVRRLGARKVRTARIPVLYEPRTAVTLAGHLAEALVGSAVDQGRSFLAERLGETVAAPTIGLIDDGRLPGGLGSRPFDGEGVATRRTPLVEEGVLRGYLLESYTARRLGMQTTGNGARPLRGALEPGPSSLFIEGGDEAPDAIVGRTERGLLVTDLLGFGFNPVTGDYSRGVAGLWIEDGEAKHAVQEVTVAGNLLEMLSDVDAVGSDLTFFGGTGAPTLRFRELTVAGV